MKSRLALFILQCTLLEQLFNMTKAEPLYEVSGANLTPVRVRKNAFVVLISTKTRNPDEADHLCTGSLIHPNFVLTVASCLDNVPSLSSIRATIGTTQLSSADHQELDIVSNITYQTWCENRIDCYFRQYTDDLCILQLANTRIQTSIFPVEISRRNTVRAAGTMVRLIGWGHLKYDLHPQRPYIGHMYILSRDECENRVKSLIPSCLSNSVLPEEVFCIISEPAIVAVGGDFGSPVLVNKDRTQVGMLIQRCPMYHPHDVNEYQVNFVLHLAHYRKFINSVIG